MTSNSLKTSWAAPHTICWSAIPFIILVALFFPQHALDIQLYDTYYVIANLHFALAVALFLLFVGMIYWTIQKMGRRFSFSLAYVHIVITLTVVLILMIPIFNTASSFEPMIVIFAAFLIAQIIFVGNVIASIFRFL
jgi:heme/copper-type cytochrome/quinol oxidase subunit 1